MNQSCDTLGYNPGEFLKAIKPLTEECFWDFPAERLFVFIILKESKVVCYPEHVICLRFCCSTCLRLDGHWRITQQLCSPYNADCAAAIFALFCIMTQTFIYLVLPLQLIVVMHCH
ncbi:hypothetical protein GOODEAATRI_016060 [Goodea atripinnis]|uniref:Uncharacterized protein n=1 Tax=Goodea atripinnis TaxID=208336 RepID=A0ABV0P5L2_9TELE